MTIETIEINVDKIDLPKNASSIYSIDRDELMNLVERKLIRQNSQIYIYFALMLDYPSGAKGLDISSFCRRWTVCEDSPLSEPDVMIAICQLEKKDILWPQYKQLAFTFQYPEE